MGTPTAAQRYRFPVGLMKRQKNDLFDRIETYGLGHAEFRLTDADDGRRTILTHSATNSSFSTSTWDGIAFTGQTRVGDFGPYSYKADAWEDVVYSFFDIWVRDVKAEAESSDKWGELRQMEEIVAESRGGDQENTSFRADEQEQISAQLKAIKESLREMQSLSSEQLAAIEARLDEAEEASHRIGRKDWWLLFLGVMLPIVFTGLVPADAVQHIIVTAFQGIGHLFSGNVPPELPFKESS